MLRRPRCVRSAGEHLRERRAGPGGTELRTYQPARMDVATLVATVFVFALFAFFMVLAVLTPDEFVGAAGAVLVAVVIAISWQFRPFRYEIRDEAITIVRGWPFKSIAIPLATVREIRSATLRGLTVRSFGIGGLFGSGGWFWNKELGRFFASVTNIKHTVLIANGQSFVISPERPDEFIADVKQTIGRR